MALMYGHKFMSLYGDVDVKIEAEREWGRNLSDFSLDDIKRGLDKCVDEHPSWPPTIGEFKALCRLNPTELGLPTTTQAWSEIANGRRDFSTQQVEYSHGIILAVRNDIRCDVYNWRLLSAEKSLKLFTPIYNEYVKRAQAGEVFELPIMIENKKDRPVTREECKVYADKHMDELKEALR